MKNDFKFCPNCGSKSIINHDNRKWTCPDCSFELYNNIAAAVGAVIFDKDYNILLEVRAKEPRKGFLAFPGGFVDANESAESAIIRECREELGVKIDHADYLCSFPNTYLYKNVEYKTCDMFFTVKLPDNLSVSQLIEKLKIQESEVTKLVSCKIAAIEDIEKTPLAFESAVNTLKLWINKRG